MHILSPETDNCPSWISGRERMTVENIFHNLHERMLPTSAGLNPHPPGLQSDGASNWATEDGERKGVEDLVEIAEMKERDRGVRKMNESEETEETRAGVCKTLCPQLPDSNTVWLQHCLAMTVTTVQIYDFNVILSKGNNSKIGDDWDKKKIRITYFFMRNQNMKFQNISIHGSKLMLYTIKQQH